MASRKPPLAEVRAAVRTVRRTTRENADTPAGRNYAITWQIDPEDVALMDAFLNGPMAAQSVVLRVLTLEQGWTAPKCDPNVSPEEAVMDDELARLRAEHADLIEGMKHVGADSAPA